MIGLFIGRFQPFHNGHLKVLRKMQRECDEIIIGIGSENKKRSKENPLSAAERRKIINTILHAPMSPRTHVPLSKIILINDKPTALQWVAEVRKKAGKFDYIYVSSKGSSAECLRAHGFKVKVVPVLAGVSGTKIRELMRSGGKWEHLIPAKVAKKLKTLNSSL